MSSNRFYKSIRITSAAPVWRLAGCWWWEVFSSPFSLDGRVSALQAPQWVLRSPPARPDGAVSHTGRALLVLISGSLTYKVLRGIKRTEKEGK